MDAQSDQPELQPGEVQPIKKVPKLPVLFFLALAGWTGINLIFYALNPTANEGFNPSRNIVSLFIYGGLAWGIWRRTAWGLIFGLITLFLLSFEYLRSIFVYPGYLLYFLILGISSTISLIDLWRNRLAFRKQESSKPSPILRMISKYLTLSLKGIRRILFSSPLGCLSASIAGVVGLAVGIVGGFVIILNPCIGEGMGYAEGIYCAFAFPFIGMVTVLLTRLVEKLMGARFAPVHTRVVSILVGVLIAVLFALGYLAFWSKEEYLISAPGC